MEVRDFVRDYVRMCNSFEACDNCPLCSCNCLESRTFASMEMGDIDQITAAVDDWSKAHPIRTRLVDFLEKYPNAPRGETGVPIACTGSLGYSKLNECPGDCDKCWKTPLDEAKIHDL